MDKKNQQISYQVLTWGPCVAKMKITDSFYDLLVKEAEASKVEELNYQHRLAGVIKKEFKFRNLEILMPYMGDLVRLYDGIWDKWRNAEKPSAHKYLVKSMWVNFQGPGEFNPPHDHSDELSFVIYLKVPPEIKKENSEFKGKSSGPGGVTFLYGEGDRQAITYQAHFPEEKDIFIFPAWLKHFVMPFKSDVERVSVSGNLTRNIPFKEMHTPDQVGTCPKCKGKGNTTSEKGKSLCIQCDGSGEVIHPKK